MEANVLRNIIKDSGKRGGVSYKGKDTRKAFDESVNLKKVNVITNFIGDKTKEVTKILMS